MSALTPYSALVGIDWKLAQYLSIKNLLRSFLVTFQNQSLTASKHQTLLYLPTQIRFQIGGERVTCHGSNLHDALGRTKLHDSQGKQQLELSIRT